MNFNYNNIEDVVQGLRKEIYGYNYLVDQDKFKLLMDNLKQTSSELILSDDWVSIKPLVERLCSFSHVKIASRPTFLLHSDILHTPLQVSNQIIASYSGFIEQVRTDTHENSVPKYYYIYSLGSRLFDKLKTVTYVTHTTSNILI